MLNRNSLHFKLSRKSRKLSDSTVNFNIASQIPYTSTVNYFLSTDKARYKRITKIPAKFLRVFVCVWGGR